MWKANKPYKSQQATREYFKCHIKIAVAGEGLRINLLHQQTQSQLNSTMDLYEWLSAQWKVAEKSLPVNIIILGCLNLLLTLNKLHVTQQDSMLHVSKFTIRGNATCWPICTAAD